MDRTRIQALVDALGPELIATRRHLHQHPEASTLERETGAYLAKRMRGWGIETQASIGGGFGVVGTLEGGLPGPSIALVAHIDAIPLQEPVDLPFHSRTPGVMHACGHDLNTAILLTLANALAPLRKELRGRVRFIFEPSEELPPGGARGLVAAGVMDGMDAVFGLHQSPTDAGSIHIGPGPLMGSGDSFGLTVRGSPGHAGAPETAVDAIQVAAALVTAFHQIVGRRVSPRQAAVITVGSIRAGSADNVIAAEARLSGTVRAFDPRVRTLLRQEIETISQGMTGAWGAAYELDYVAGYPPLINDERMTEVARRAALMVLRADAVIRGGWPPGMPMDDFSCYLERAPGCYAGLGVGTPGSEDRPRIHTPGYVADESALAVGLAWYLALVTNFADLSRTGEPAAP